MYMPITSLSMESSVFLSNSGMSGRGIAASAAISSAPAISKSEICPVARCFLSLPAADIA